MWCEMSGQLWSWCWLKAVSLHSGEWSLLDFSAVEEITPPRSQKGTCESWPLLESQTSIAERKFGIWLKTENHRGSVSKDSWKGRFSSSDCQSAVVLSKRVHYDAAIDKRQRSFQGFQLAWRKSCHTPVLEKVLVWCSHWANDGANQEGQHLAMLVESGVTPFSEPTKCPKVFGDVYLCHYVLPLNRYIWSVCVKCFEICWAG